MKKIIIFLITIFLIIVLCVGMNYYAKNNDYENIISMIKGEKKEDSSKKKDEKTEDKKDEDKEEKKEPEVPEENSIDKYVEITETLTNPDCLNVTEIIDNKDGTITLKGHIRTVDTSREQIAEYPFYKETEDYRKITVSSDLNCRYSIDSYQEANDTVKNVFEKRLFFGGCFNFEFENGVCTSVYEVVTGH